MKQWDVVMTGQGRSGDIVYTEGAERRIQFYWEMGAKDVLFLISGPPPQTWEGELPWASGRRREILERVAESVIRQESPSASAEISDGDTSIIVRRR